MLFFFTFYAQIWFKKCLNIWSFYIRITNYILIHFKAFIMSSDPYNSAILTGILNDLVKKIDENQTLLNVKEAAKKLISNQSEHAFHRYSATIRLLALMDELNANELQKEDRVLIQPSHIALEKWLKKNNSWLSLSDFTKLRKVNQGDPDSPRIQWNNDQSATFDNEYEMAIILDLICSAKSNTINVAVTLPQCPERRNEAKDDSKRILDLHKYVSKIYETTLKNGYPHESVKVKVNHYTEKEVAEAIDDAKKKHSQEAVSTRMSP